MAQIKKVGELEVAQDLEFQKQEWKAERIGWIVAALLLLAALLGLFGTGPVSKTTARSETGEFSIEYQRFSRYNAQTQLLVTVGSGAISEGTARLVVDQGFINNFDIQRVVPQPDSVEITSDTYIYSFTINQPGDAIEIIFDLQANKTGVQSGAIGLENGQQVNISQFVYP